jgi:phospholipid transport system transporter-binding protein
VNDTGSGGQAKLSEVLKLEGALTFESLPGVLAESAQYAERADLPDVLTIDFSGITGVDSSAVALLLEWRRQALKRAKTLQFANLPDNLMALAELYGVAELILLHRQQGAPQADPQSAPA